MFKEKFLQCSTPKESHSRRRTLGTVSSPKVGSKRGSDLILKDSLLIINEDEAEKKAHRKSLTLQSFQKTPAVLSSPKLSDKTPGMTPLSGPRLNADQLKQHYTDCIKLSTENKINAKNAFGLHLLEYIDTILQEKSDNFQVVGCTIDAGAKIYAGRVDAVHGDILQMLGTMGNAEADYQEGEEDEIEDADKKKDKKKKKKITLCEGRTIEKNLTNIRNTAYDLSFDVDPLIQITSRQSDEQCTASLISYNIELRQDSLLFDSTTVCHTRTDTENCIPALPTIDTSHLSSFIPCLINSERAICPSFESFRFNNWTCTEEKSFYEMPPSQPSTQESEQAEPFVPGMADMVQDEEDFGGEVMSSGDEGEEAVKSSEKQKLTIDDLTLALEPTEYGYFNPQLAQMWAGPGHWKLKPLVVKVGGEKKERKKKTATTQTFDSPKDDLFKNFIKSRAKTKLCNETIRSNQSSDNVLPIDINYLESNLRKLSLMPLWRGNLDITDQIKGSQESSDKKEWYNYENPNDLSNYCPNDAADSDDDVEVSFGSPGADKNTTPIGDLELIDAAAKIERIDIQYAKQAKKIDVKKLKSVMWTSIANTKTGENIAPNMDIIPLESDDTDCKALPVNFSDIYKKIPHQVSVTMAENLSVPIAFACLLHLANEHGLQLDDNTSLTDVRIVTKL